MKNSKLSILFFLFLLLLFPLNIVAEVSKPSQNITDLVAIPLNITTSKQKQVYLENMLDSTLTSNNILESVRIYRTIGYLKKDQTFYHLAITYFQKGLEIIKPEKNKDITIFLLNDIGACYRRLDDLKQAYKYHYQSFKEAKKRKNRLGQCYALNGLGNVMLAAKDPFNALLHFKRALTIATADNIELSKAVNNGNIGLAYISLKKYDLALKYFFKSLDNNKSINHSKGMKICYTNISDTYLKLNQINKSLKFAKLALSESKKLDELDRASVLVSIATLYRTCKNYNLSSSYASKAVTIASSIHAKSIIYEAFNILKNNFYDLNQKEDYLKYYEKSLCYLDSITTESAVKEITDLMAVSEINNKNHRINQLVNQNKINKLQKTQNKHYLIIIILATLSAALIILLISIKIASRALKKSSNFEIRLKRSQLNPHFIYNSLNSIQKYIWNNNPDQASIYLCDFSLLMRKSMESMRLNTTILSKEIELLNLYLKLEQQRLSGGFSYTITVDPELNPDEINIPPLITQPFIENAVWHGVAPIIQLRRGQISVNYKCQKGLLHVEIRDNGTGFNKAKFEKQLKNTGKNYESAGIKITTERLNLSYLNIKSKRNYSINIVDLSEITSDQQGTLSTIQIPYKEVY